MWRDVEVCYLMAPVPPLIVKILKVILRLEKDLKPGC